MRHELIVPDWSQVSDHTHTVSLPRGQRKRPLSAFAPTVISEPRRSWFDSLEAVARYEINRLDCGQWVNVEGVVIQRTEAHSKCKYRIGDNEPCDLESAVKAVCQLAGSGVE